MESLHTFLAGFILGCLTCYGIVLFTRRDSSCWSCTRARHCSQLPAEENPDV